jgi:hypothetical protein
VPHERLHRLHIFIILREQSGECVTQNVSQ